MSSSNGVANWIPDGYTESVYFEGVDNLHGDLRFTYRPILITTLARINREMNDAGDDDTKKQYIAAKWMGQRLVSWDMKKPNGESVDFRDQEQMVHVRTVLFNRLWNCIGQGIDGGDHDPKKTAQEQYSDSQTDMAVAMREGSREEVLEGN